MPASSRLSQKEAVQRLREAKTGSLRVTQRPEG